MASLVIIGIVLILAGILFGSYLVICFAISREDRVKGSLRFDATSQSTRSARSLVGVRESGWDQAGPP